MQSKTFGGARRAGWALALALLPIGSLTQPLADGGLSQGRAEAARGDFYRALLTLKDATRQLEARPDERLELARAYASLAWAHLGMNQPLEAQAAVESALKTDPTIVVTSADFPATVVSLFDRARRPAEADPEEAGQRALKAGRNQEALLEFQRALRSLPSTAPAADVERLRTEIIEAVTGMDPKPPVPNGAEKHLEKARELEEAQALFGAATPASTVAVLSEFEAALRLAPWWPEALFGLAQAQHSLGRLDESLATLRLYRLADPGGLVAARKNPVPPPAAAEIAPPSPDSTGAVGTGTVALYFLKYFGPGRVQLKCDKVKFADLAKARIVEIRAAAGPHTIRAYNKDLSLTVEPGVVHYIRGKVAGFPGHIELDLVAPDVAAADALALKIVPNDAEHTYSATCGVGKK